MMTALLEAIDENCLPMAAAPVAPFSERVEDESDLLLLVGSLVIVFV